MSPVAEPPEGWHKIAQLLGETLVHHAPWSAQINEQVAERFKTVWLDRSEAHLAKFVGPILQKILDSSNPPAEITALLQEAIAPTEALSETIEQIFVWGIVSQIITVGLTPFLQGLTNDAWTGATAAGQTVPLSPATIATMVVRNLDYPATPTTPVPDWAVTQAAKTGISQDDINAIVSATGMPPSPQDLFEMLRRGIIQQSDVEQGLREGDTRDEWIANFSQLAHTWLTPDAFVRAAVQNQLPYATAEEWANATGLDTSTTVPLDVGGSELTQDMFGLAVAIAGRPPGPEEAGRMANRGIIDWTGTGADATSFEQVIAESDVKTKYTAALQALQAYIPPPRTVGNLLKTGSITSTQAKQYWEMSGVPSALADAYVHQATTEETEQEKVLAKGNVLTAYYDGIIDETDALSLLGVLGYSGTTATIMLQISDFRREIGAINKAVNRIGSLYMNFKMTLADAKSQLNLLGIPDAQITNLIDIWGDQRIPEVRLPTISQIGKALEYGAIDGPTAMSKAEQLGYTPMDAYIILSGEGEAPVPGVTIPADTNTGETV